MRLHPYLNRYFPEINEICRLLEEPSPAAQQRIGLLSKQMQRKIQKDSPKAHIKKERAFSYSSSDGIPLQGRLFFPITQTTKQLIVFVHGGGMVSGSVEESAPTARKICELAGALVFSVAYRLAPAVSGATLVEDVYAGVVQAHEHAKQWGIDPQKMCIVGQSAGAGLAAGVALLARARGRDLEKQLLIYPMLDPNTGKDEQPLKGQVLWTYQMNQISWAQVHGGKLEQLPVAVTPLAAKSFVGLPETYLDCGTSDIFREECLQYVQKLLSARVPVEFHLYDGLPHAFETFELASVPSIIQESWQRRIAFIKNE